jgi:hypothetical protein
MVQHDESQINLFIVRERSVEFYVTIASDFSVSAFPAAGFSEASRAVQSFRSWSKPR